MCFSSSDGEYVAYFIRMAWLFKTISLLEIRSTLCSLQKSRKETFLHTVSRFNNRFFFTKWQAKDYFIVHLNLLLNFPLFST